MDQNTKVKAPPSMARGLLAPKKIERASAVQLKFPTLKIMPRARKNRKSG